MATTSSSPSKPCRDLGRHIRDIIATRGLTQRVVATLAAMRPQLVSQVVTGANVESIAYERLASALGFPSALVMFQRPATKETRTLLLLLQRMTVNEQRRAIRAVRAILESETE